MLLYGRQGKLKAQPGRQHDLEQAMLEAARLMRPVDGCLLYLVATSPSEPDAVLITEVWTGREAHAASLHAEGVQDLIGRVRPMLAGPPEGIELALSGGKGL